MTKQECIGIPDMILLLMIFLFKKIKIKAEIVLSPGGAYFCQCEFASCDSESCEETSDYLHHSLDRRMRLLETRFSRLESKIVSELKTITTLLTRSGGARLNVGTAGPGPTGLNSLSPRRHSHATGETDFNRLFL